MCKRNVILAVIILCLPGLLFAQKNIMPVTPSSTFSSIAGTPKVIRVQQDSWLVVWRQGGNAGVIAGRFIFSTGSMGASKSLQTTNGFVENGFDIAQNSRTGNYVLVFETSQGLFSQLLTAQLGRAGSPKMIEGGSTGMIPRIVFNANSGEFYTAYFVSQGGRSSRQLKGCSLDQNGSRIGNSDVLATAPGDSFYQTLSMARNPSGNFTMSFLSGNSNSGKLNGINLSPSGNLINRPLFQVLTSGLRSWGALTFSSSGVGLGFWSENGLLKNKRIVNTTVTGISSTTSGVADINSLKSSAVFDTRSGQFVGVWAVGNKIRGVFINPSNGKFGESFSILSSSSSNCRNVSTSYDSARSKILAVWEDSNSPASVSGPGVNFQIRGAIFETSVSEPDPGPDPDPDPDPDPNGEPDIDVSRTSIDLNPIENSDDAAPIRITNTGSGILKLQRLDIDEPFATDECFKLDIVNDAACNFRSLGAGQSCQVDVRCTGICGTATEFRKLSIPSNDKDENTVVVSLSCGVTGTGQ